MILSGRRCSSCGAATLDWSLACPACGSRDLGGAVLSGRGRLYSSTTVRVAPSHLQSEAPYHLVVAALDEGPLVVGRWAGMREPAVDSRVHAVRRDHNTIWFDAGDPPA